MNESTNIDMTGARVRSDLGQGPYKVSTRGGFDGRVSSQWFSRPDDQRFVDLDSLAAACRRHRDTAITDIVDSRDLVVRARDDDPDNLAIEFPTRKAGTVLAEPTHWSFGQLCTLTEVPAHYVRKLPGRLAGINLQYGLQTRRQETLQAYMGNGDGYELRAATGPEYGRIYDVEVVEAVQRIAGNGTGDTRWKVPGVIDWRTMEYNPDAPITKRSTTLFASDRDVFLFLVDDKNPIEIGTLPSGDPDLLMRGFIVSNSEVGSRALAIATFYLRGVCQNRCLWGVEGMQEIRMRHSKYAPSRFMSEARPALESFANSRTSAVVQGVQEAKRALVADTDDDATNFLLGQRFSKPEANKILETVLEEEGRPARSIWDMVQGITAYARDRGHQDERLMIERKAGKLLDRVARAR